MNLVEQRIADMGLTVPTVVPPVAVYLPALRSGAYVFTSGQLPMRDGFPVAVGKVGAQVSPDLAAEAAEQCALNAIAALKALVGDLDIVKQVVKVVVFVASDPGFTGQPTVANGASELLKAAFGEAGSHTRSAVGVAALPLDVPVEVEVIFEL